MGLYEFIDSSYRYQHKSAPRRGCQSDRPVGGVDKLAANGEKFGPPRELLGGFDKRASVTARREFGANGTTEAITDAGANNGDN